MLSFVLVLLFVFHPKGSSELQWVLLNGIMVDGSIWLRGSKLTQIEQVPNGSK
jgi:hypothetical protein